MTIGKDLIDRGRPEGPTIGLTLAAAKRLRASGRDEDAILHELEKTRATTDAATYPALEPLSRGLLKLRDGFGGPRRSASKMLRRKRPTA